MGKERLGRLVQDVGRRVSEVRRDRGWTQEQMSEMAGFTLQYLQKLEGGRENLTLLSLDRIARLLGVKVIELFRPPKSRKVRRGRPPKPSR